MVWLWRFAFGILLVAPSLAAVMWSSYPALVTLFAVSELEAPRLTETDWEDREKVTEVRRNIQRHFSQHKIYVPLEDIVLASPVEGEPGQLALFMQKACGRGRLFVWIPFRFRLPWVGEKVIEWCWKPKNLGS